MPPPPPVPTFADPAPLCGSTLEHSFATVQPFLRCEPHAPVEATYRRVGIGDHDVVALRVIDFAPTFSDGPPFDVAVLAIDGREVRCPALPCAPLDALHAGTDLPDDAARALLAIAAAGGSDALADTVTKRDALATTWRPFAERIRRSEVGLSRTPTSITLSAWTHRIFEHMHGWSGRLEHVRVTLASGGSITRTSEVVFDGSGDVETDSPWRDAPDPDDLEGLGL